MEENGDAIKTMAMAMAMTLGTIIPPGFRFRPSVTELIRELNLKMLGNAPRLGQFMPTLDLAELDPWEILGELNMLWEDEEIYFWRNREKLSAKGNQYNRKGKSGFWKITCAEEEILDSKTNKCIGKKRILVYYKGRSPGKRTDWVMHEYALNNESASFVICVLKEKTMKTEKTMKSKRAKKDADIPESLKGVPSGYTTVSDVEIPITPAEIVLERGSFLLQNLPLLKDGESSYDFTSIGEISPTANSSVSDSVIDSIQPPNSTEGHKDMPTSHGFGESEASMEELMDMVRDPDENIYGPETTDGSQKISLELLRKISNDDDNNKESSQQISSELTSFKFVVEELGILYNSDDYIRGIADNFLNRSCQKTSEKQHFLYNPVSRNMDAEGADGQVDVLGPFGPGGMLQ